MHVSGARRARERSQGENHEENPLSRARHRGNAARTLHRHPRRNYRYSANKHSCTKVSCGTGKAWSKGEEACLGVDAASLSDDDYFNEARIRVDEQRFAEALDLLFRIKNQDQAKVLNYIGYSTRKLGDVEKGIDYYHRALEIDPNYLKAREYLGEGYLQKGDVASAKEQLDEIANRCGGPCEDYELLVQAIAAYIVGEPNVSSYAAAKPSS